MSAIFSDVNDLYRLVIYQLFTGDEWLSRDTLHHSLDHCSTITTGAGEVLIDDCLEG
jgi:hypothetical protein